MDLRLSVSEHIVPLPSLAVDLIRTVKQSTKPERWVFASHSRAGTGNAVPTTQKALGRALLRNKTILDLEPPIKPHDLRRTCRTGMGQLGIESHIAERVIGHKIGGIAQIYDRHTYLDERRAALEAWAERISSIVAREG